MRWEFGEFRCAQLKTALKKLFLFNSDRVLEPPAHRRTPVDVRSTKTDPFPFTVRYKKLRKALLYKAALLLLF